MSRHWLNCAGIWRKYGADITAAVLPCWVAEGQHFAKFACDSCEFWYSSKTYCLRDGSGVRVEGSRHLHFSSSRPLSTAITCPCLNTVMALRGAEEHSSLRKHWVFEDDRSRKHLFCSNGSKKKISFRVQDPSKTYKGTSERDLGINTDFWLIMYPW